MTKRNYLFIGLGIFAAMTLCVGAAFVGNGAYNYYNGRGFDIFSLPAGLPLSGDQVQEHAETNTREAGIGSEVDLRQLFAPLWESRELLNENFLVQPIDDKVLAEGALAGLEKALEAEGIDISQAAVPEDAKSIEEITGQAGTPDEAKQAFAVFWETWQKIDYAGYQGELTYQSLMQESLRGMVAALGDDYTSYMDPIQHQQSQIDLQGEYEGIGAWVDPTAEYLTITAPMAGSPAEKAGLLPGDRIIAIDGEDMTGIDGNIVITKVLGPAGSLVVLTIEREGMEPFDVEIIRSKIVPPTVETDMFDGDIAYIQLYNFNANSAGDLHEALATIMEGNPKGLIFDLRNNGGGYLHTAVSITSEFLDEGIVLIEEYGDGTRDTHEVRSGGIATQIPIVVLVNEGTASASEIFAGAIQDYDRGVLVGSVTFGKGLVQLPVTLSNDQGSLRITIARWLTPLEHHIQGAGLEPDYLVPSPTFEDVEAGNDAQLEKALEILWKETGFIK